MERIIVDNIKVFCAYDKIEDIENLIPNPKNPNTHPEKQIKLLAKIIKSQGWRQPITVSKLSGFIVKGHGRLESAIKLGLTQVPVEYQEYPNEASEYADLMADNRIAEFSKVDMTLVNDLINNDSFTDFDVTLTGFDKVSVDKQTAIHDMSDDLIESLRVEITVKTEKEQEDLYNELMERGLQCRLLKL